MSVLGVSYTSMNGLGEKVIFKSSSIYSSWKLLQTEKKPTSFKLLLYRRYEFNLNTIEMNKLILKFCTTGKINNSTLELNVRSINK